MRVVLTTINDILNKVVTRKLFGPITQKSTLCKTMQLKYNVEFQILEIEIRVILLRQCLKMMYYRMIYNCKKMLRSLHRKLQTIITLTEVGGPATEA